MWRRASSHLQTLATPWRRSAPHLLRQYTLQNRAFASITSSPYRKTSPLLSSQSDNVPTKKRVEDVMPIATGHEQKELEAELDVSFPGDEHDVVWFWLGKDKPHECPVCSQYFVLEVIGEGGDPEAHSDDEHH